MEKISDSLTIKDEDVKEALQVYRVMNQVGNDPEIKASESTGGGMKDRYYSLVRDAIKSKKLEGYFKQNPSNFELDSESLARMKTLGSFENPARQGAIISSPTEWRPLGEIWADEDYDKRSENILKIEEEGAKPSEVWADRKAELTKAEWSKWLVEVLGVVKKVSFGDDLESQEAIGVMNALNSILIQLESKEK